MALASQILLPSGTSHPHMSSGICSRDDFEADVTSDEFRIWCYKVGYCKIDNQHLGGYRPSTPIQGMLDTVRGHSVRCPRVLSHSPIPKARVRTNMPARKLAGGILVSTATPPLHVSLSTARTPLQISLIEGLICGVQVPSSMMLDGPRYGGF